MSTKSPDMVLQAARCLVVAPEEARTNLGQKDNVGAAGADSGKGEPSTKSDKPQGSSPETSLCRLPQGPERAALLDLLNWRLLLIIALAGMTPNDHLCKLL